MSELTTNWFHKVDGLCSLIGHRRYGLEDDGLAAQLIEVSSEARQFADAGIADRYAGGFPITLETMVKFAEIHGKTDELRRLLAADPPTSGDTE